MLRESDPILCRETELDRVTPKRRSEIMALVRSKDTKPEMKVRRLVHALGFRYRLHCTDLPGTPDLVFRAKRRVIFVHGCFWHGHNDCPKARLPKTRVEYWRAKRENNLERDARVKRELSEKGWNYMVVWQCQLKDLEKLTERLMSFLSD